MKLASHNTMTYLNPSGIKKIFKSFSKCQEYDYIKQFEYGCVLFDLRVKFDKKGNPYFAHGKASYKSKNVYDVLKDFNDLAIAANDKIYIRMLLEEDDHETYFKQFCEYIKSTYNMLIFCGGWKAHDSGDGLVYDFKTDPNPESKLIGEYSSYNNGGSGKLLDQLSPKKYAKKHNKKNIEKYKDQDVFLHLDFIGVYS